MTRPSRLLAAALAALALAGCASTQKKPTAETKPAAGAKHEPFGATAPAAEEKQTAQAQNAGEQQGAAQPKTPQLSPRAQRLFDDAVQSYNEQKQLKVADWTVLEKKFRAVLEADSSVAEAWYDLGVVLERQRRTDDAKSAYKKALDKKPLKQAMENLAVMAQNEGRNADAVGMYQDILRTWPDDGAARARLAAVYREAGDVDRALKFAREALMREPANLTAYKVLLRTYLDRNNLNMAKLVALRAKKLADNDPELISAMGMILLKEGDEEGAVAQLRAAVVARDDYAPARLKLAEIAAKHRDWTNAAEQYKKMAQYDPKSAAVHNNLAVAYKGLGQFDKAMAEYEQAIKLDPSAPQPYFNYGVLFQKHKDAPEKALEYYKKFLAASRDNVGGDHPVFENIKECEQYIRQMQEAKAAEERAKIEAKAAEDRAKKEADEKKRQEEEKKREEREKQKADEDAKKAAEREKRQQQARESVDAALKAGGDAPARGAKAPEARPAETPKAAAPAEQKPAKVPSSQEPSDEPVGPEGK